MAIRKVKRERERSRQIIESAVASGDPFTYLYEHIEEMGAVVFDDFIVLLRVYPPITITSHDIVDAYERNSFRDSRYIAMLWDIVYLLRNRGAESGKSK